MNYSAGRPLLRLRHSLADSFNHSGDATMVVPAEYLDVVIIRK